MKCSIENCDRLTIARGWCAMHYARWKQHGSPLILLRGANGSGYVNADGYREVRVKGRAVLEHRNVMEDILGRPLLGTEHVHHIDGDKLNNSPSNLQAMSREDHMRLHGAHGPECRRGHTRNESSVYLSPDGRTMCRVCNREAQRRIRANRRKSEAES